MAQFGAQPGQGFEIAAVADGDIEILLGYLGHPLEIIFRCVDKMSKTAGGKFEEFISEIITPPLPV